MECMSQFGKEAGATHGSIYRGSDSEPLCEKMYLGATGCRNGGIDRLFGCFVAKMPTFYWYARGMRRHYAWKTHEKSMVSARKG